MTTVRRCCFCSRIATTLFLRAPPGWLRSRRSESRPGFSSGNCASATNSSCPWQTKFTAFAMGVGTIGRSLFARGRLDEAPIGEGIISCCPWGVNARHHRGTTSRLLTKNAHRYSSLDCVNQPGLVLMPRSASHCAANGLRQRENFRGQFLVDVAAIDVDFLVSVLCLGQCRGIGFKALIFGFQAGGGVIVLGII